MENNSSEPSEHFPKIKCTHTHTVAIVMAMSASVTVSIGDETMGVRSTMFLVTLVVRSTCDEECKCRCDAVLRVHTIGMHLLRSANPYLMGAKVDVPRMENNVIVSVANTLQK